VVVALGLVAVLVLVAAVCVGTVAIVVAHRRAQVAADLASLAAAAALQQGGDPCTAAALIAGRHAVTMSACVTDGPAVTVVTSVRLLASLGGAEVPARSRAGPQESFPGDAGQQ
jgi:secretion/DNA translocation related TadE-like protein